MKTAPLASYGRNSVSSWSKWAPSPSVWVVRQLDWAESVSLCFICHQALGLNRGAPRDPRPETETSEKGLCNRETDYFPSLDLQAPFPRFLLDFSLVQRFELQFCVGPGLQPQWRMKGKDPAQPSALHSRAAGHGDTGPPPRSPSPSCSCPTGPGSAASWGWFRLCFRLRKSLLEQERTASQPGPREPRGQTRGRRARPRLTCRWRSRARAR